MAGKEKESCEVEVEVKVNDNGRDNCKGKIRLVSSTHLSVMQDESDRKIEKVTEGKG